MQYLYYNMYCSGRSGLSNGIMSVEIGVILSALMNRLLVLDGNISPTATLPLQKVVARQILLQGSCASAGEYPRAIELVASGAIQVKPLITAVAPLTEGPAWFERLHAREPNLMKIVLTPGAVS